MYKKTLLFLFLSFTAFSFFICSQISANSGEVMWTTNGRAVCAATGSAGNSQIISDDSRGAIIVWEDYRNHASDADIYVQRMDANGNQIWLANGVVICNADNDQSNPQLVSDANGGAIITWRDKRNGIDYDIYAQRIDARGEVQWATNGIAVCTAVYDQDEPALVADGLDGTVISWQDQRSGATFIYNDIYSQKVNGMGQVQWLANGVAICTANNPQYTPKLTTDGNNGTIIIWDDNRQGGYFDVYGQKINSAGVVQWTQNGVAIASTAVDQKEAEICSDDSNGAIVVWQNRTDGSVYDIYSQRINGDGAVQWAASGVVICNVTEHQLNPVIINDGNTGAIMSWNDYRNDSDYDVYAQRIDINGSVLWTVNGVAVSTETNNQLNPQLISDYDNGAIIAWSDYRDIATQSLDVYAQRINSSGSPVWTINGVAICTDTLVQAGVQLTTDGARGAIICWEDSREGVDNDIYAQRIEGIRTWYLAEGATLSGFDEWITIQNPNDTVAAYQAVFMKKNKETFTYPFTLDANSRGNIHVNQYVADAEVAAKIESTNGVGVIAERSEYFSAGGNDKFGGHCSIGVPEPQLTWYFAEGVTLDGYDTWVSIQNPNSSDAICEVTFMKSDATTIIETVTVESTSRSTVNVNQYADNDSVSTKVSSTNNVKVTAERIVYWDVGNIHWGGGHCSIGAYVPNTLWYFAEGATVTDYTTWIAIQNPHDSEAQCRITFMKSDGQSVVLTRDVDAHKRDTVRINDYVTNDSVSTKVESTNGVGIVSERVVYWNSGGLTQVGGHCSIGVNSSTTLWYLAEGSTQDGNDEWVTIQNPNTRAATCQITFMMGDGSSVVEEVTVEAARRSTVHVNDFVSSSSIATKVESTNGVGVIVERPMYWESAGIEKAGGHCSCGTIY